MESYGTFPFGENVRRIEQTDRTHKKYFIIGSYASAVHATWRSADDKVVSKALPVANEPEIMWTGRPSESGEIIRHLHIPPEAGRLSQAGKWVNGGIGRLLNLEILTPLNLSRNDVWLTLLIPYAVANKGQRKAIHRYSRIAADLNLPGSNIKPSNIKSSLVDENRINELIGELEESKADVIITLGDLPLYHFIRLFEPEIRNLSSFEKYGQFQIIKINNRFYQLLPLYHPKAGENVGSYTQKWKYVHNDWINNTSYIKFINSFE